MPLYVLSRRRTDGMKKTYKIEVDCAVCAGKMEETAKKAPGVANASVSFLAQKMKVEFEEGADPETIMKGIAADCKKFEPDSEIYYE